MSYLDLMAEFETFIFDLSDLHDKSFSCLGVAEQDLLVCNKDFP